MSTEENKAVVRRYLEEVVNRDNRDTAREVLAPAVVWHLPGLPDLRGLAGDEQLNAMFRGPFPDAHVTVDDMVAEGDKVSTRLSYRGTHLGEFQGMPATGKSFVMCGMQVARIAEGKLVEAWALPDMLGLLQQLRAIPAPG
jgi:predicted ester cyclase